MTDRETLLSLLASLTLCDHMGDVAEDVSYVLKQLGEPYSKIEWDDLSDLGSKFGKLGIKTLHGTELSYEDD